MISKFIAFVTVSVAAWGAWAEEAPVYQGPEYTLFSCKMLYAHDGVETLAVSTQKVTELFVENDVQIQGEQEYAFRKATGVFEQKRVTRYVVNREENQEMFAFAKETCDFTQAWEDGTFTTRQLILCRDNVYLRRTLKNLVGENVGSDDAPFTAQLVLGSEGGLLSDDQAEICRWMR